MAKSAAYDYLIKLIIIGDSGVGKTCFLMKFAEDNFTTSHISTIGIDFKIKTINIDGKNIKLQIWDTAGQERFRTITQTYYKGAMGIILAYDCTDEKSFNNIRNWINQIEQHASSDVAKILVGNKCDRPDKVIDPERGKQLADEFGMKFYETSARSGLNVNDAFLYIAKDIKDKNLVGPSPNPNIKVNPGASGGATKKGGCCGG